MFLIISIYFTTLFIAPQLWMEPFVGLRTDFIFFPIWIMYAVTRPTKLTITSQDKFLIYLYLWIIISIFANGFSENYNSVPMLVNYTRFILIYFLVRKTVINHADVEKVVKLIIIFVGLLVIEGIQHKTSSDGLGWAGQSLAWVDQAVLDAGGSGRTRWVNIFDGPGVFCVVYTLALPFTLRYLDTNYSLNVKVLSMILILPLLLALYYTGSRGGFLGAIAIIGLYIAIRSKISFTKIFAVSALISIVFMMAPTHLTQIKDKNKSAQHRVDMWFEGVEMLQQNPVIGIGRGNFKRYTSKLIAHNSAIEIMGELGFVGFFLWAGVIYLAFKNIIVVANTASIENARLLSLNQALGLAIVGYLVSSMFVTLEYETFYFLLALPAALAATVSESVKFTSKDFKFLGFIIVMWVVLLKAFIMIY